MSNDQPQGARHQSGNPSDSRRRSTHKLSTMLRAEELVDRLLTNDEFQIMVEDLVQWQWVLEGKPLADLDPSDEPDRYRDARNRALGIIVTALAKEIY